MAKTGKDSVDPEMARFYEVYPRFPGVQLLLTLLRSGKAKGTWLDILCGELGEHAAETADELIAACQSETEEWVQAILLSVIAETGLPEFTALLTENLSADSESLRYWAKVGLEKTNAKEARTILWQFRSGAGSKTTGEENKGDDGTSARNS